MKIKSIEENLVRLFELDQAFSDSNRYSKEKFRKQAEKGYRYIKRVFEEYGFVDSKRFGKTPCIAAWTLVQHAGKKHVDFMEKYLKEMRKSENFEFPNLQALLKDRILVYKGKPQTYGSQLTNQKDDVQYFESIKDVKNVDKRRQEAGLEPLHKYAKGFKTKVILPKGYEF